MVRIVIGGQPVYAAFEVPAHVAVGSDRLGMMLSEQIQDDPDESGEEEDGDVLELTVYGQSRECMEAAMRFVAFHANVPYVTAPKPIGTNVFNDLVACEFDRVLVNGFDAGTSAAAGGGGGTSLVDLVRTAQYLKLPDLLDLAVVKLATLVRGRTLDEINHALGIECDPSPEAVTRVHAEYPWLTK